MYYDITCVRFAQRSEQNCSPAVTREYETGLLFEYNYKRSLIRSPYKVTTVGRRFYLSDPYGNKIDFGAEETSFTYNEILELVEQCSCCTPFMFVHSDEIEDNGDGTYSIPKILAPDEGDVVFDESLNLYEYKNGTWIVHPPTADNSNGVYNIDSTDVTDNGDGTYNITAVGAEDGDMAITEEPTIYEYVGGQWVKKVYIPNGGTTNTSSFLDYFRTSYIGTTDGDQLDRSTRITVSNVNQNTFETDIDQSILDRMNFNPLADGTKWAGYIYPALDPAFQIEKYENGVFTYSLSGVTSSHAPVNGDKIELLNPYVNYKNNRPDDTTITPEFNLGSSFDGGTITYSTVNAIHRRSDGLYIVLIWVSGNWGAGATSRVYKVVSWDMTNWTVETPHFSDSTTTPYGIGAGSPCGIVDIGNGEFAMVLASTGPHGLIPAYCKVNDNLDIISPMQELPINGYDYSVDKFRCLAFTRFEDKYRLIIWKMDNLANMNRPTIEIIFDSPDINKVFDGTSANTKNIIHVGSSGQGYLNGWIDSAGYVEIDGTLNALFGISDQSNGNFITKQNRVITTAVLVDGVWQITPYGPTIFNPIQWDKIDNRYTWQRDHFGGNNAIINSFGTIHCVLSATNGTNRYNNISIQLKGVGSIDDFVSDYITVTSSQYTADKIHTILADSTNNNIQIYLPPPRDYVDQFFYIKKTSPNNSVTISSPGSNIDGGSIVITEENDTLTVQSVLNRWVSLNQEIPDFIEESERDQPGGFAGVGMDGFIPSLLLPSYVDDVLEFANFASLPPTGESGKIYVTLDDNKTYRWSGSAYVEISPSLALGETSSTAYRGDRGKTAYDHSQVTSGNPHNVTAADVGLGNVDNTSDADKPVSTAQGQAINQAEANANQYTDQEIGNLGTASQADVGDFATAPQGAKADSAVQPNLQDISGADWVLDEDDMISDSDTKVPTQQSVKAYVDANAGGAPVNLFTDDLTLTENRLHDLGDNEFAMSGEDGSIEMAFNVGTDKQGVLFVDHEQVKINSRGTGLYSAGFRAQNFNGPPVLEIFTGQDLSNIFNAGKLYLKAVNQYGLVEYGQIEIPEYATDTDANNDSDLESGAPYYVTGEEVVKVKGLVSGPVAKNLFTEDLTLGATRTHDLGSNLFRLLGSGNAEVEWGIDKQDGSFYSRSRIRLIASTVELLTENLNSGIKAGFATRFSQGQEPTLVLYTGQTVTNSNKVNKFLIRKTFNDVEFGNLTIPEYASDTDADNDAELVSGAPYSLTGDRTVYRKP